MSKIKVLDSHALLAYLEKEPSYEIVQKELELASQGKSVLFMSIINWGEVCYIVQREYGKSKVEEVVGLLDTFPVEFINVDRLLTEIASAIKAKKRMAYADCFSAALAMYYKAPLLTGDKEFRSVEKDIKIIWLK